MIKELQEVLYSEIPLTKNMGVEVRKCTELSLTLYAPLENNINHKSTAFGGSLYSVSVLSGWGLIYLLLKQHNLSGHIVIQESHIKYLKPVASDIMAECSFVSKEHCNRLIKMYKKKGVARIQLESRISNGAEACVIFNGRYVIHS